MKNKVLIKLIIPKLDLNLDFLIPVNDTIYKTKKLMIKTIQEFSNISDNDINRFILINKNTSKIYLNNEIVFSTDIRNATELILFEKI